MENDGTVDLSSLHAGGLAIGAGVGGATSEKSAFWATGLIQRAAVRELMALKDRRIAALEADNAALVAIVERADACLGALRKRLAERDASLVRVTGRRAR